MATTPYESEEEDKLSALLSLIDQSRRNDRDGMALLPTQKDVVFKNFEHGQLEHYIPFTFPKSFFYENSTLKGLLREWGMISNLEQNTDFGSRHLLNTGHLAETISSNCDASEVYENTDYDDFYQPECECWQLLATGEIYMECNLGDESCQNLQDQGNGDFNEACTNTVEYFFFHEDDGDLQTKASCTFCSHDDEASQDLCAEYVREICTFVTFEHDEQDLTDEPASCRLTEYNASGFTDRCDDCLICNRTDDVLGDVFGIQHTCFGEQSSVCDTNGLAHLHNFVAKPGVDATKEFAIDVGEFSEICMDKEENAASRALYDMVSYDDQFDKVCDCDIGNTERASISCDLHDPRCFANTCTDVSEVFIFDSVGQLDLKWTVSLTFNGNVDVWTQVRFDPEAGVATECGVVGQNLQGSLYLCTNCELCLTEGTDGQQEIGIRFACFDRSTRGACVASNGRAQYNLAEDGGVGNFVESQPSPSNPAPALAPSPPSFFFPSSDDDKDRDLIPLIVIIIGGCALLVLAAVALALRSKRQSLAAQGAMNGARRRDNFTDEETVASSVPGDNDQDDHMSWPSPDEVVVDSSNGRENNASASNSVSNSTSTNHQRTMNQYEASGVNGMSEVQLV